MKGLNRLVKQPEPTFQDLVLRAASGNREAFDCFVQEIERDVMKTAFYLTQNQADAEDVAQEVYLSLLGKAETLRAVKNIRGWVFRVTVNASRDLLRKRRKWTDLAAWFNPTGKPVSPLSHEVRNRLAVALKRLSFNERAAFVFKELHDLPTTEVADLIGCQPVTVRGHLLSARKKLRLAFGDFRSTS